MSIGCGCHCSEMAMNNPNLFATQFHAPGSGAIPAVGQFTPAGTGQGQYLGMPPGTDAASAWGQAPGTNFAYAFGPPGTGNSWAPTGTAPYAGMPAPPSTGQYAGMKKVLDTTQVKDNRIWVCGLVPLQFGPGSARSRNLMKWMLTILGLQFVSCVMRVLVLKDYPGSCWMLTVICLGVFAYRQKMNVMYTSLWGILCLINGIFGFIGLVLPVFLGIAKLKALALVSAVTVPCTYVLGAFLAVHLYQVSADEDEVEPIVPLPLADPMGGSFFDKNDPFNTQAVAQSAQNAMAKAQAAAKHAMPNMPNGPKQPASGRKDSASKPPNPPGRTRSPRTSRYGAACC